MAKLIHFVILDDAAFEAKWQADRQEMRRFDETLVPHTSWKRYSATPLSM